MFVAGIDLGGTAINYTIADADGRFLIDGLFERPAGTDGGPDHCLTQMADGLGAAARSVGLSTSDITRIGLDSPGPASSDGVLSARGSTNFVHPGWRDFDLRSAVELRLGAPVAYLNDGNAAARWGHFALFGPDSSKTSVSVVIGTGLGGGIVCGDRVITGRHGFGGEVGHVIIPYERIPGIEGLVPRCNCGRVGDVESLCSLTAIRESLLPHLLRRAPAHALSALPSGQAAKLVRGLAEQGDPLCLEIFRVQAIALGMFFDQLVNLFDPDVLIVGGGALETGPAFQRWFIDTARAAMPTQRAEQADLPIAVMPNGDTAGARGAAVAALDDRLRRRHEM